MPSLSSFSWVNIAFTWFVASSSSSVELEALASRRCLKLRTISSCISFMLKRSSNWGTDFIPESQAFTTHHGSTPALLREAAFSCNNSLMSFFSCSGCFLGSSS